MADEPDESEKTEEPTQKKLDDAKRKGNLPKSQEVTSWFMMNPDFFHNYYRACIEGRYAEGIAIAKRLVRTFGKVTQFRRTSVAIAILAQQPVAVVPKGMEYLVISRE